MTNDEWLLIDSDHIVQPTLHPELTCCACNRDYVYVRDRCPFCYAKKDRFEIDESTYYIKDGNVYADVDGEIYIWDSNILDMVKLTDFINQANQPHSEPQQHNQQYTQTYHSHYSGFNFGDMISTTIAVFIFLAIFIIIVAFLDVHVFHGA